MHQLQHFNFPNITQTMKKGHTSLQFFTYTYQKNIVKTQEFGLIKKYIGIWKNKKIE